MIAARIAMSALGVAILTACDAPPAAIDAMDAARDAAVELDGASLDALLDAGRDVPPALDVPPAIDGGTGDVPVTADVPTDVPLPPLEEGELAPGGETTTDDASAAAFLQQAANLSIVRRGDFEAGLQFVQLDWEVAPGRPEADGLGPLLNAASCLACHVRNGRGAPASDPDEIAPGVLLRIGAAGIDEVPGYGDQLQILGIPGVPAEGHARRTELLREHTLADGTTRSLTLPVYEVARPAYGALPIDLTISPRIAQQLVGQGLLEAIAEADVLALEDEADADADGISGRARWLDRDGAMVLGRFGWKAGQPTVEAQTAAAFLGDLGITSPLFLAEGCEPGQLACASAPNGGAPELTAVRLRVAASYVRLLGVPPRRDGASDVVRRGRTLFFATGCAGCHHGSYVTGEALEPELAHQRIWPYTDLLLHDMGEALADHRIEGSASGDEWRTPPLWGIGLLEVVNGTLHLLHDGRARSVEEAVLWHGGEADAARVRYEELTEPERAELVAFVMSL